jgi:thioredoxin-like negative regulator of GroEL
MQQFGGGMGLGPAPPMEGPPEVGKVYECASLNILNKMIKETPGLIVDFWSPSCPPCMRIKPTFEAAAKANENPNLIFVACNTKVARDCAQAFGVSAIPNFIAFFNGKQFKNFKGANEGVLYSTIAELSEKIPKGKVVGVHTHNQLSFNQFRPSHLAP